jgi:clan AA aspartic protease
MINGVVNAQLEATIRLVVLDATGQPHDIGIVVDTGYNGSLALPPSEVAALGLAATRQQRFLLPDGSIHLIDVYGATTIWDGQPRTVEVDAIDSTPLVGTALLQGHELKVKFVVGGPVTIEAVP